MARLEIERLSKHFGSTVAVQEVSLDVGDGEFVMLLGPSGCGKTTTLRMIAGFIAPTAGHVRLGGKDITVLPPWKRNAGMVFQSYALFPHLTVAENVAFGLEMRKITKSEIPTRVTEALRLVRLGDLADRMPRQLSGGQQQRVALARALVTRPDVLLLDEPLSNLDANLREEMRFEIRRLHDAFHFTTVYVTHDQGEAMVTSDRIAVMNLGRLEQIDAPHALYTRPKTRFVAGFIGRTNFLEGRIAGDRIAFDHFDLPRGVFQAEELGKSGAVVFSVWPHCISLHREAGASDQHIAVQARLVQRAYLGEYWDYVVSPLGSDVRLKVAATPSQVFDVGDTLWLKFDPQQMAPIEA
jgi:ABC-type Fe3+/spermidine/putrescine transport system ATPase subunit